MYSEKSVLTDGFSFKAINDVSTWDLELLEYEYAHPYQSMPFSSYMQEKGFKPVYILILDGEITIGHCSVLVMNNKMATWYHGPIVKDQYKFDYNNILQELKKYLFKKGIVCFDKPSTQVFYADRSFEFDNKLYYKDYQTPFVKLKNNIEDIYAKFNYSVIKNIKKSEKRGVKVLITNQSDYLGHYLTMLHSHRKHLSLNLPPFYPNLETMKIFSGPNVFMDLALASIDNTYIAGIGFLRFGKMVIEIGVAQSDNYFKVNLPAHDFIKVKAIQHYKMMNLELYDLSGVEKYPSNKKEFNIRRFKTKFSQDLGEYCIMGNNGLGYLRYLTYKIKNKLKTFKICK